MNPNNNEQTDLKLPALSYESGNREVQPEAMNHNTGPEIAPGASAAGMPAAQSVPQTNGAYAQPPANPILSQSPVPSNFANPATSQAPVPNTNVPDAANDLDVIEKEWVMRVKEIVEQTKADPRLQAQQINNLKAAYLKKRFGKEIKTEAKP